MFSVRFRFIRSAASVHSPSTAAQAENSTVFRTLYFGHGGGKRDAGLQRVGSEGEVDSLDVQSEAFDNRLRRTAVEERDGGVDGRDEMTERVQHREVGEGSDRRENR